MLPGVVEAVDGAPQVGVYQVVGGRGEARQHRRLGRGFDNGLHGRQRVEVLLRANVAVHELHPARSQARQVQLRAPALEVIEGNDPALGVGLLELQRQRGAHEASAASNKE